MDDQDQTLLSDAVTVRSAQAPSAPRSPTWPPGRWMSPRPSRCAAPCTPEPGHRSTCTGPTWRTGPDPILAHLSVVTDRPTDGHCSPAAPPDPAPAGVEDRTVGGVA